MASKHYYRVLYNLILKKQKEAEFQAKSDKKDRKKKRSQVDKVTIAVMKYQPIDFSKLVEFIHCGSVEINSFSVAGKLSIYLYIFMLLLFYCFIINHLNFNHQRFILRTKYTYMHFKSVVSNSKGLMILLRRNRVFEN